MLSQKSAGVKRRDNLADFVRFKIVLCHDRRGATTTGAHAHNMHWLLVEIAEREVKLCF